MLTHTKHENVQISTTTYYALGFASVFKFKFFRVIRSCKSILKWRMVTAILVPEIKMVHCTCELYHHTSHGNEVHSA